MFDVLLLFFLATQIKVRGSSPVFTDTTTSIMAFRFSILSGLDEKLIESCFRRSRKQNSRNETTISFVFCTKYLSQ